MLEEHAEEVKVFVSNGDVLVPESKYNVGDLIKFRHEEMSSIKHISTKTSYSVITKVMPMTKAVGDKKDKFVVNLLYITENKKGVEEKDILDLVMMYSKK